MTALPELEPRLAGNDIVEPDIEFEKPAEDLPVDCQVSSPTQTVPVTSIQCC
jgi:hypothetical protein